MTRTEIVNKALSPLGLDYQFRRSATGKKAVCIWSGEEGPQAEVLGAPCRQNVGTVEMEYDDDPSAEEFESRLQQAVQAAARLQKKERTW